MKKFISLLLGVIFIVFSFTSCGNINAESTTESSSTTATTEFTVVLGEVDYSKIRVNVGRNTMDSKQPTNHTELVEYLNLQIDYCENLKVSPDYSGDTRPWAIIYVRVSEEYLSYIKCDYEYSTIDDWTYLYFDTEKFTSEAIAEAAEFLTRNHEISLIDFQGYFIVDNN